MGGASPPPPIASSITFQAGKTRANNGILELSRDANGTFKVYGNFCWGGEKGRAEVYFLPAGQQAPAALSGADVDKAKRTQQQLIAMGMKGRAVEVSDTYAEFEAPEKEKILHGSGEQAVVRLVLYDNKARRTSGVPADSTVQRKGTTQPFPILWVLGGLFGVGILLLPIVAIGRGGGQNGGAGPPHAARRLIPHSINCSFGEVSVRCLRPEAMLLTKLIQITKRERSVEKMVRDRTTIWELRQISEAGLLRAIASELGDEYWTGGRF